MAHYKEKKLDFGSELKIGKYKGERVFKILEINPSYILWLSQNTDQVFTPRVIRVAEKPNNKEEVEHYKKWASQYNYTTSKYKKNDNGNK
jgi:hypothetical protein